MTQILAAFIAIPYGLSVLMRGSDGLNRGTYSSRDAGLLTVIALIVGLVIALRRKLRLDGFLTPGEVAGRGLFAAFLIVLIAAGLSDRDGSASPTTPHR